MMSEVDTIINREPFHLPSAVFVTWYLSISSLAVCNIERELHKDRLQ